MRLLNNPNERPMTHSEAVSYAQAILEEEANQIASFLQAKDGEVKFPHRIEIAIRREMQRLRQIAAALAPVTEGEEK